MTAPPPPVRLATSRYDFPHLIDAAGYETAAELGVNHGYFSYYLLRHSKLRLLWSVDDYQGKLAPLFSEAQSLLGEFGGRVNLVKLSTVEAAALAARAGMTFDFVYIDADHRYKRVRDDLAAWRPLIRAGGVLAGHDYLLTKGCGVIRAVNEAAAREGAQVFLTRERWASWFFHVGVSGEEQTRVRDRAGDLG